MVAEGSPGFDSLADLEGRAGERAPADILAYINGGSGEERSLRANLEAFRSRRLRPRVLRGVSEIDLTTTFLGTPLARPWYVAPMAYQGDIAPGGELAVARAAAGAECLAAISTLSSASLEEIARAAPAGRRWFQLYLQPELEASLQLVRRAAAAGYGALVVTVDVPMLAVRDRQRSGGFAIDERRRLGNAPGVVPPSRRPEPAAGRYRLRADAASDWEVIDRLREATRLPIVLKGILRGDDAATAVDHGVRGIIVSNHGGRQLDGAIAALDALPEVVAAVGDRAEVYVEGGVRRASDILIARALGARGVGIGRPVLWALLAGGESGVAHYFELLTEELVNALALAGLGSLDEVGPDLLA